MIKNLDTKTTFSVLPELSFFTAEVDLNTLYQKRSGLSQGNAISLTEHETNHGHSFDYAFHVVTIEQSQPVILVDVIKIDISLKTKK